MNNDYQPVQIGKINKLQIVSRTDIGFYLDGRRYGEILLPGKYAAEDWRVGDWIDAFLYLDSEDRFIATTETPYVLAGELAWLEAVAVTKVGVFVDWGLPKDLLVPFREQKQRMQTGKRYLVYVYFDETSERMVGSTKIFKHIGKKPVKYKPNDEVSIIVCAAFDRGYTVIVDKSFAGALYKNEVFQPLQEGMRMKAYIAKVRQDSRIDVSPRPSGNRGKRKEELSAEILSQLHAAGGFLPVGDKSSPEEIRRLFAASKKEFKEALGNIYKKRLVAIEKGGIRLVPEKKR